MKRKKLVSTILIMALLLVTVMCPMEVSAADTGNGVPIDEEHFPDPEFKSYIAENCDSDGDKVLSQAEIQDVTSLGYLPEAITSIKGIEYFTNLRGLAFERSKLTELDVSHNPKLQELAFECADITELDVSHNPELKKLECWNSNLTSLNLSNNPKLEVLRCSGTNLSALDVSHNPELNELHCRYTNLTNLDLSGNPKLAYLECSDTNLKSLDISHNPELYYVNVSQTKITNLDTSHNPNLQSLSCSNTNLKRLDLSHNPMVWELRCNDTDLAYLSVCQEESWLKVLDCENTKLTSLDLRKNTQLAILEADGCPLISLLVPSEDYTGGHIGGRCIYCDNLAPYKLTLQSGQDSIDLKTIAPSIVGEKIYNLSGCEKQGTVLSGLKDGQTVTYSYDYNGGSINVVIEVSISGDLPENPAQNPTVSRGEGYTTSLSEDGTIVAITVTDGYTLEDVRVNGISKGKTTIISGLKTGDRVEIIVSKVEVPEEPAEEVYDLSEAVITIPAKSYSYTGKTIKPTPTVMFDGVKLKKGTDYTVSYSNNKKIGTATVTIEGQGAYEGSETLEFKIIPKKVVLSSAKSLAKKSVTVKWKKVSQATGYQIQWCKSGKFSSALSAKVKGASVTSKKISKLQSKKKYYVRVRAYKVVNGKTYYGKWSSVKSVRVK